MCGRCSAGTGGEVRRRDVDLDAGAGEGEERLQHPVREIRRRRRQVRQEDAPPAPSGGEAPAGSAWSSGSTSWDVRPRRRRAARVRSKGSSRSCRLELVEDQAVVDAEDPRRLAVAVVPELPAALLDLARVDRAHVPELLGEGEVDRRLLGRRIEVEQHDVLRRQAGEDGVADGLPVGAGSRPERTSRATSPLGAEPRELLALGDLEGVERREGLELDQLRSEASAVAGAHDGEVRDREGREGVAARHVEVRRHRRLRSARAPRASRAAGRSRATPRPSRRAAPAAGRPATPPAGTGSAAGRAPRGAVRYCRYFSSV